MAVHPPHPYTKLSKTIKNPGQSQTLPLLLPGTSLTAPQPPPPPPAPPHTHGHIHIHMHTHAHTHTHTHTIPLQFVGIAKRPTKAQVRRETALTHALVCLLCSVHREKWPTCWRPYSLSACLAEHHRPKRKSLWLWSPHLTLLTLLALVPLLRSVSDPRGTVHAVHTTKNNSIPWGTRGSVCSPSLRGETRRASECVRTCRTPTARPLPSRCWGSSRTPVHPSGTGRLHLT